MKCRSALRREPPTDAASPGFAGRDAVDLCRDETATGVDEVEETGEFRTHHGADEIGVVGGERHGVWGHARKSGTQPGDTGDGKEGRCLATLFLGCIPRSHSSTWQPPSLLSFLDCSDELLIPVTRLHSKPANLFK